jgi:hypothetical protein
MFSRCTSRWPDSSALVRPNTPGTELVSDSYRVRTRVVALEPDRIELQTRQQRRPAQRPPRRRPAVPAQVGDDRRHRRRFRQFAGRFPTHSSRLTTSRRGYSGFHMRW